MLSEEYDSVWFIWHGGEPLLLPLDFYKKAIELQEKYFGKNAHRVGNTIQTNGLLLDKKFMNFCKEKYINVGISYEGKYNDILRQRTSDVEKNINMLAKKEYIFSIGSTIGRGVENGMSEIYKDLTEQGLTVSFTPVTCTGCPNTAEYVPDADAYIENSIKVFDEWFNDPDVSVPLIPHYLYMLNALGDPQSSDCAHSSCLMKWISIYPDGSLYPCGKGCPEEYKLCNLNDINEISDAFRTDGFKKMLEAAIERRNKCSSCSVYEYCNGGCVVDAFREGGTSVLENPSCKIYREVFTHVKNETDKLLDEKPDLSEYNHFVRDAIVGKLINPKIINQ